MPAQVVDPQVSRTKFEREIAEYRRLEGEFRARGWVLVEAEFPKVLVVLCATKLVPPAVITGVQFDFTNYDEEPPSVRLVNPFSGEPYPYTNMPTVLKRRSLGPPLEIAGLPLGPGGQGPRMASDQPLMQPGADDIPFLCIAGVREYHEHPAHSGDSWDLSRRSGAGRLIRLLEVIDAYGVRPITGYNVALVPQIVGFAQNEVPE
jgi:hypothetical protein